MVVGMECRTDFLAVLLHFFPGIFEGDGAVEHGVLRGGVVVGGEVAQALELELGAGLCVGDGEGLDFGVLDYAERVGVEHLAEVAFGFGGGVLHVEESVV